MKYTPTNAQKIELPGGTTGVLYPAHPSGEQSIAVVKTVGMYPEKGYSVNDRCTEAIYLISGRLEVTIDNKVESMDPGDLVMILPGQKYSIRGTGEAIDIITPSWDAKQNHLIE